jgi:ethanolamine ammonia-lyase large subunit
VIGVNPASDSVGTVGTILHALNRLVEIHKAPTQSCCLAHISAQPAAMDQVKTIRGAGYIFETLAS